MHKRALIGLAAIALVSCTREHSRADAGEVSRSWNPAAVRDVDGVPVVEIRSLLQGGLAARPPSIDADSWSHVKRLYKRFGTSPLWFDDAGLITDRADALVDALVNATTDAIAIDRYPLFDLALNLDTLKRTKHPTAAQLARSDLLLTTSYAALSEDYLTGQIDPRSVAQSWHIDPEEEQVDSALVRSLRDKNLTQAIARMRPTDYDYDMLRRAMADYRRIASAGGWQPIPKGKSPKRGQHDPRIPQLRARLRLEGIDSDSGSTYDSSLAAGIARFQAHHGINVDSALGPETLDALNVPATFRLAQIAANLERFRWLPHALPQRYILVNVPAFRLEGYDNGTKTIEMKVIVGAEYEGRATPVFSDKMEFVVFRPYWDVPDKIAQNEILPKGVPSDFEVTSQNGKPHLRQRPGPKNALGLAKFMFPNDFNIYLHDTPQDQLFQKDVRAFSHGCIRVEKPAELAQWVLGWDAGRVEEAMNSGPNNHEVRLPSKIPVFITYFTAYVRDGQLWFGNDLYGRDDQLVAAVVPGAIPSASAARAVAALRKLTD